jgi:hypothetical protein
MTEDTVAVATGANASKSAKFNADFDMVMKNGSAHHQHKIYNFTFTNMSMPGNSAVQIDGTITVTMRDGPVHEVPVTISLQGDVISISLDPNMTNNHFGHTPIYGVIDKLVHIIK